MTSNAQRDPAGPDVGAAPIDGGADVHPERHGPPEHDGFEELRSLLIGPERAQLAELHERLGSARSAEEIGQALPDAVRLRSARDGELSAALMPTVEEAVKVSVRKDTRVLVDALFPVMGPAIRKAVASALAEMIQSLNAALERSVSIQGLRWRLEAMRTGRPFGEVVLLHSLVYRVEQVFLIHNETGLLLYHVVAPSAEVPDAELMSAMLTAIQDFGRDSLNVGQGEGLDTVEFGAVTMWIERGPRATLAGVIRGSAPQDLREVFQNALEGVCRDQSNALLAFAGDTAPFEASRPYLEACVQARYASKEGVRPSPLLLAIAGAIVLALGLWLLLSYLGARRWEGYLADLRARPGIVVTDAATRGGKYVVAGLRDPLAADPAALLAGAGIDADDVEFRWEPYQSFAPEFLLERARAVLDPPPTVALGVDGTTIHATGSAPHEWIVLARRLARSMPGVAELDTSRLVDEDWQQLLERERAVEAAVVMFVTNTARLAPGQERAVDDAAAAIRELLEEARRVGAGARVEIRGHTDSSGTETTNTPLSLERAETMAAALAARGVPAGVLSATGAAGERVRDEASPEDAAFNRSVTFRVDLAGGA
jgi:OOP family OmpA-OmpF porin